jgi:hypothetical protein
LKADPSVAMDERGRIVKFLRNGHSPTTTPAPPPANGLPRVFSRSEAGKLIAKAVQSSRQQRYLSSPPKQKAAKRYKRKRGVFPFLPSEKRSLSGRVAIQLRSLIPLIRVSHRGLKPRRALRVRAYRVSEKY